MRKFVIFLIACYFLSGSEGHGDDDSFEDESMEEDVIINLKPFFDNCIQLIDTDALLGVLNSCDVSQHVSEYLQGEKFATISQRFWSEPEFLEVFQFIYQNGYPEIYDMINKLYEFLGLHFRIGESGIMTLAPPKPFPFTGRNKSQCDLPTVIDEIQIIIPISQFERNIEDAVESDASIRALIKKVFRPVKIKALRSFMEMSEVQDLITYLKSKDTRLVEVASEVLQ